MKKLLCICLLVALHSPIADAQKIGNIFWGSRFGITSSQVYENLKAANLEPIVGDDAIYLKDNVIYAVPFQTIGMKFTSEDAFYNIFGYNKFDNKQAAMDNLNEALATVREKYPNLQVMGRVEGCLKLYAYADADNGEAFSLGLYKGNGVFFVRLNIFSDYLLKREGK